VRPTNLRHRQTPAVCEFTGDTVEVVYALPGLAGLLHSSSPGGLRSMLMTIVALLLILWLLGMVTTYTVSGFLHVLLVIAVVLILVRLVQGRSVV
jgi:hypothetical protein